MATQANMRSDEKKANEKEGRIKQQIFVKWGRGKREANNVNCEEMRFVIRNLVVLKIPPGNGARNST